MAQFSIKTDAVRSAADTEEGLRRELGNIQQSIRDVSGSLSIRTSAADGIRRRLGGLAGSVGNHQSSMGAMKNALERVTELYGNTERSICGHAKDGMKFMRLSAETTGSSLLSDVWKSLKDLIGAAGAVVGGILNPVMTTWGKITEIVKDFLDRIGKGDVTDQQPNTSWRDSVIGSMGTVIESVLKSPSRYNVPEYALGNKGFSTDKYGRLCYGPINWKQGGCGSVCCWNVPGQLSCTYYTMRRLTERGLGYPCTGGPGNGKSWYDNFDKECGLPHYPGTDALDKLVGDLTLPQANVVVSFDQLDADHSWGHVLLIDEIYRDEGGTVRVKYSDMIPDIPDLNGTNPQLDITLEEFKSKYEDRKYYGPMKGAAVIGAGYK